MPLTTAGATFIVSAVTNDSTPTFYDNTNAYLGVGDDNTAFAVGQTDLQAVTNKNRQAMEATFPTVASNVGTFKSQWATGDGNFAWAEWALFNASTAGTMLTRKVEALGTKTSAQTWELQADITFTA